MNNELYDSNLQDKEQQDNSPVCDNTQHTSPLPDHDAPNNVPTSAPQMKNLMMKTTASRQPSSEHKESDYSDKTDKDLWRINTSFRAERQRCK